MLCVWGGVWLLVEMLSILSRSFTTIEAPSHVPRSRRITRVHSPGDLPFGFTTRNLSGKKKRKIELDNNPYHNTIIKNIDKRKKEEHTGRNCLIKIDNSGHTADSLLCKECVKKEIESERKTCVETIAKYLIKNKNGFKDKKGQLTCSMHY